MYKTTIVTLLFVAIFESLIIIVGNIFTIFVFWKNRNSLKRTSFLPINLAVADLLVGFAEPKALGTCLPRRLKETSFNVDHSGEIFTTFHISFSFASVFLLALISPKRAYALIWPLRHRAASISNHIYGATLAWVATIRNGALHTLAICDIVNFSYCTVATSFSNKFLFLQSHFGKCICFDLAATPSSSKFQMLHLRFPVSVDNHNICLGIDFAGVVQYIEFHKWDSCN